MKNFGLKFLNSQVWSSAFEIFGTKTETGLLWAISVSSKRNIKSNDFELVLSRQTCSKLWNHVLNYASGNGLGTK